MVVVVFEVKKSIDKLIVCTRLVHKGHRLYAVVALGHDRILQPYHCRERTRKRVHLAINRNLRVQILPVRLAADAGRRLVWLLSVT